MSLARPVMAMRTLRLVRPTVQRLPLRPFTSGTTALEAEVKPRPAVSETKRAEQTLRRFWKSANVNEDKDGFLVSLDHRPLKTPGGKPLRIPKDKRLLAMLIANEWENQDNVLKQHALPLTSLTSRAIDGLGEPGSVIREGVIDELMEYLETDTICFPGDKPRALVRLQKEHWDPLHMWLKDEFGVELGVSTGFGLPKHGEGAHEKLRAILSAMSPYELAAFERAVYATKSFAIALALVKGRLTANEAAQAAHAEVQAQIEQWGEVEDTHDVDYQDIRRALGSVAMLLARV